MTDFLLLAFVFLCAGVVAVPIAARLGLSSVLGYLIAGILIGPVLELLLVDVVSIQHFAEFGVVMMLFLVGLELKPKMLWSMRHRLLGLGMGQVGLTTLVVMCVAMLFGQPWRISLAIGLVLAMSSTAIALQTLKEKRLMNSDGGQASLSVLLFQDIAVIPMLAFIPLLALPELADLAGHGVPAVEGDHGPAMSLVDGLSSSQTAVVTLGAVSAVVLGGNFLTVPLFRFIAAARLREMFTATALMLVIGIALLMTLVGLSPALGTFLAGVVLANSEYRHELESDIDPFKGLLLGLFFMTVGAGINFALLFENLGTIIGITIGVIAIKTTVLLILAKVFKLEGNNTWLFGLGLAQASEFSFVLLSFTVASNVIPIGVADQLSLVVALSMLLSPLLFYFANKFSGLDILARTVWAKDMVVFISYSRRDTEQMQNVAEILEQRGFDVKIDKRDLPFGEEWQAELSYLIKQSDIIIWLASQNSANSRYCEWELGEVARFRKKLVPIVIGNVRPEDLPRDVQKIQLLPTQGIFNPLRRDHIAILIQLLGSDTDWIKLYSRLSDRAQAWDESSRSGDRLLTTGAELSEAEAWQVERPLLAPQPLPLVLDYIHSSRIKADRVKLPKSVTQTPSM